MQGIWLIAFSVQWVVILVLVVLVFGILRHLFYVQERWNLAAPAITKYEIDERIADFALPDINGISIQGRDIIQQSSQSSNIAFLFVSATCPACLLLLNQLAELKTRTVIASYTKIVVIVLGDNNRFKDLLGTYPVLTSDQVITLSDSDGHSLGKFGIRAVPVGIVVNQKGEVVTQTLNPHANDWLYKALNIAPPAKSISKGHVPITIPAAYLERNH